MRRRVVSSLGRFVPRSWLETFVAAGILSATWGCSGDEEIEEEELQTPWNGGSGGGGNQGGEGGGGGPANDCNPGATKCEGTLVAHCQEDATWALAEDCPADQTCQGEACADPTAAQIERMETAEFFIDELVAKSAWHEPIDADALRADAYQAIIKGDGSETAFLTAMRAILLAVPQGHQGLYGDQALCETPAMFYQNYSRFGVCARPAGDEIVVTFAEDGNELGLQEGDRVVAVNGTNRIGMYEEAAARPVCGASSPSLSHRWTAAAASLFGTIPAGSSIDIRRVDGTRETLVIPEGGDAVPTSCQDPLGRDINFNASSYLRPDGVAVVRLPRFYPIDQTLPQNPTPEDLAAFVQYMTDEVLAAFEPVSGAPALIWDARSNYGGISLVGLAIAGGMPGAVDTSISYCQARIPGSDPPSFYPDPYAVYDVVAGGPFAFNGPVAVLIDGLDYSAADYFPYAVKKATNALLVGSPTAGAYGGASPAFLLGGTPDLYASIDGNKCLDADTGEPLEGIAVEPDIAVEYDSADLASGIDSVMEAAAAALLAELP